MSKATIKHVALEAGVSTATVSRALTGSGYVSDEVKERVMAAVEKLHFQPSAVARSLKQDKTYTIGVIIPDISNTFFMSLSKGIEDVVQPEGYNLLFCSSDESPDKERELLALLQEKRVDAVALATAGQNEAAIVKVNRAGTRVVLLDRRLDNAEEELDLVTEDNRNGAYRLTRALLQQGHTRIGVINGFLDVSTGRDRYEGYLQAMEEAGLRPDPELAMDGEFSVEGGVRAASYLMSLKPRPTALLSFNNNMAFGALCELVRLGIDIPGEVAVASYGETEAVRLLRSSGFLYMQQLPYEMGTKAGELLLRRLQQQEGPGAPMIHMFQPEIKKVDQS